MCGAYMTGLKTFLLASVAEDMRATSMFEGDLNDDQQEWQQGFQFDGVVVAGFKSGTGEFYWPKLLAPCISSTVSLLYF